MPNRRGNQEDGGQIVYCRARWTIEHSLERAGVWTWDKQEEHVEVPKARWVSNGRFACVAFVNNLRLTLGMSSARVLRLVS